MSLILDWLEWPVTDSFYSTILAVCSMARALVSNTIGGVPLGVAKATGFGD